MVMRLEPVAAALAEVRRPESRVILLDPAGEVFSPRAGTWARGASHLVLVCARYEGVDERIRAFVDRRALDRRLRGDRRRAGGAGRDRRGDAAVARRHRRRVHGRGVVQRRAARVPAVHAPGVVRGRDVPPILVSGHHEAVRKWRLRDSSRGPSNAARTCYRASAGRSNGCWTAYGRSRTRPWRATRPEQRSAPPYRRGPT